MKFTGQKLETGRRNQNYIDTPCVGAADSLLKCSVDSFPLLYSLGTVLILFSARRRSERNGKQRSVTPRRKFPNEDSAEGRKEWKIRK
jgi:hypothetical protein